MTTAPESPTVQIAPPLTLTDYCDAEASGVVQAYVRLVQEDATLDLCSHHFSEHAFNLMLAGWEVAHDQRDTLA